MNTADANDILIEALDVFLNHILYTRDLYPSQIFKKRRIYNTPVYASIFPPLNAYLHNVLRTARELLRNNELQCVQVALYNQEKQLDERYTFQFDYVPIVQAAQPSEEPPTVDDEFLLDFEEQLRGALYRLAARLKGLKKLPKGTSFKVLLHTTQAGFVRLSNNSHYQEFPWLRDTISTALPQQSKCLLPLAKLNTKAMQLYVDVQTSRP